ncbi:hypothetical protein C2G38_2122986 [Gigaspora rosea]|uniref:Uncharacterized protein n=1 Tax=Gigaspora rosea TaxID=44941 RepID=A0A397TZK0_9GLOM|nr:hypothetical protein C2G38_2122986 [Gigaspora rosea]
MYYYYICIFNKLSVSTTFIQYIYISIYNHGINAFAQLRNYVLRNKKCTCIVKTIYLRTS